MALQATASNATDGIPLRRERIEENFIELAFMLNESKSNRKEHKICLSRWGRLRPHHHVTAQLPHTHINQGLRETLGRRAGEIPDSV